MKEHLLQFLHDESGATAIEYGLICGLIFVAIVGSLAAMVTVGLVLLTLSGPVAFWVCGLLLCLFVGPTQSAARTLLLRMTGEGKEGVAFGLYTTTGRAVAFLAPWLFFVFVDAFGADRAGMGGICLVLAAGLAGMLRVRVPG